MSQEPLDYESRAKSTEPERKIPPLGPGLRMIALAIVFLGGSIIVAINRSDAGAVGGCTMAIAGILFLLEYVNSWNR